MKKCKFCLAEIEDEALRCPACGKELDETATQEPEVEAVAAEPKKATPGKIALAVAAIVVLLAMLVGLVLMGMQTRQNVSEEAVTIETVEETVEQTVPATVPADGEKGTVQEKGTYTASEEELEANQDTVVAKLGDKTLTNGELQIYYWNDLYSFVNNYYYYLSYVGLDIQQSLDTQLAEGGLTWQQYFLKMSLEGWHQYQAMALEAEKAGFTLGQEEQETLAGLEADLEQAAQQYDVTLDEYFRLNFGTGTGFEDYYRYMETYYQGQTYYNAKIDSLVPTAEQVEAYFAEHEESYAGGGITKDTRLIDVRHILLQPETAEDGTITEEAWAACEKQSQELLDAYLAGEVTEEAFAALANEHSTDPGSNTNGGLYEGVAQGDMVDTFDAWCFDETRKPGDTGRVKTDYGYHLMYFVASQSEVWKTYAAADWVSEKGAEWMEATIAGYELEVFYDQIRIADLIGAE